jgi:RNA polymerase sigma-70 factor (ECF subfamily)
MFKKIVTSPTPRSYLESMDRYRAFYDECKDRLFAYLIRITGDYDLASDILQEAFTRYLEHYRGKDQSVSLLYAIARHALFDHLRKQGRTSLLNEGQERHSGDQEQALLIRDEYRRVLEALHRIEKSEREILALAVSGDLTYREIASITGTSESNVKVKVHRARVKLKEILNRGDV